jgi:hypothetical protein
MLRRCNTFDDVVAAFGGPSKLGRFVKRTPQCICKWRERGAVFPAGLYFEMIASLRRRGYQAPRSLWSFERLQREAA